MENLDIQQLFNVFSTKEIDEKYIKLGVPLSQMPVGTKALLTSTGNRCCFQYSNNLVELDKGTIIEKMSNNKFKILATHYTEKYKNITKYYEGGVRESQYLNFRGVPLEQINLVDKV